MIIQYILIVIRNDSQQRSSGIAEDNSSCKFFLVSLPLGQSFANRSNLTVKRSTSTHRHVERKHFGENSGTYIRAIKQVGSIGKDLKPLWFSVKNI
ncbi:hypothetical protein TNIN_493381 [Trichonephila inaurata madagascariensis]|uniref:Uncharacterized protein n=1 Tax=Trichonephila inaurata madagascariensis TaxID=2747483 RepID=A0A8X6IMV4_9ARAC|nr:hypothetical protein TNIN_493381 [Trichonephila inaurata madagascariensis]